MTDLDINSLIADKIMGEPMPPLPDGDLAEDALLLEAPLKSPGGNWTCFGGYGVADHWLPRPFCTRIGAAMEVWEALRASGDFVSLAICSDSGEWDLSLARYSQSSRPDCPPLVSSGSFEGGLPDLARHICLVALRTVGIHKSDQGEKLDAT